MRIRTWYCRNGDACSSSLTFTEYSHLTSNKSQSPSKAELESVSSAPTLLVDPTSQNKDPRSRVYIHKVLAIQLRKKVGLSDCNK